MKDGVGWGGWGGVGGMGWGGLQLATRQCDSEVLKGLPDWTRSTSSVGGGYVGWVAVSNQTVQTSRSDGLQPTSSDTRSEAIPFPRSEANYFLRSEATPRKRVLRTIVAPG